METIEVGKRKIGNGCPVYMIAEMSANHAGSLERAKEIVWKAKECGADCIKIQTYTPDTLTIDCHNSYFEIENGTWKGENLYSLYGKAYTPWEWQGAIKEEADRAGIDFLSTPFDKTAVDFLENLGVGFYKIASFELVDLPLISYAASKGKPIILSTGMAAAEEIREAVDTILRTGNKQIVLLKCSSAYPADPADMHLRTIADMKERFGFPVGLSDHSMGSLSAVTAVALGASVIEKHFCLSREIENPDASFSMTPAEFKAMVEAVRNAEQALGGVFYGVSRQEESSVVFRRSLFAVKDIAPGEKLTEENIRIIRPGYGLAPREYEHVLGKVCESGLKRGTPLDPYAIRDYLTLVPAKKEHCELVFTWANDPETRAQSFSVEPIAWEDHCIWYESSLVSKTRSIYICYHGNTPVGVFRTDLVSDTGAEISYQIAPGYRHRGYSAPMIWLGQKHTLKKTPSVTTFYANIKNGNTASQKTVEKLGYRRTGQEEEYMVFSKTM